jgi:hypothetical protein
MTSHVDLVQFVQVTSEWVILFPNDDAFAQM